jgi:hypothetical protein
MEAREHLLAGCAGRIWGIESIIPIAMFLISGSFFRAPVRDQARVLSPPERRCRVISFTLFVARPA